ncbi:MAG: ribonuclease III [Clostridiales Family XIII bacterium]|jgi:ribonuclease-3 family protein|nr:ribonuclease III [Clostridiales Family XIII bacterium]
MKKDCTTLAFLGDAFYELSVRRRLAERGGVYAADKLHRSAVHYVKASAQAKAARGLIGRAVLAEEELDIVRRARNRKPKSIPKNADPLDYKYATAFEALLGFHYLEGRTEAAEALIDLSIEIIDSAES